MSEEIKSIEIEKLNREHTQLRVKMCPHAVEDYAEALRNKKAGGMPPIIVFHDGNGEYFLADGFHRTAAAELNEQKSIKATIKPGTLRDAILYAATANKHNAVRFSNADKRKAVSRIMELTKDDKPKPPSQHWIAQQCGVTQAFVSKMCKEQANGEVTKEKRFARSPEERIIDACNTIVCLLQPLVEEHGSQLKKHCGEVLVKKLDLIAWLYSQTLPERKPKKEVVEPPANDKPKRGRGRPKNRYRIERWDDNLWWVVDTDDEAGSMGGYKTKAEAEECRKGVERSCA